MQAYFLAQEKIVNLANNVLVELRYAVNRKEIPKNENSEKVIWYCWRNHQL